MSELANEIVRQLQEKQATQSAPTPPPEPDTQRTRALAQGLTFGGADEAEAWLRSRIYGEDYDTALKDVRGKLDRYRKRNPMSALAWEAGGATLPAIGGALFTGGGSAAAASSRLLPTLYSAAKIGALEGGIYSFLTGEGKDDASLGENAMSRLKRVPFGATAGAAGGVAGTAAVRAASKPVGEFLGAVRRKIGDRATKRVEREMERLLLDSDLSLDDALKRIENGEVLAEMSDTLRDVARSYRAQSRSAATVLENAYAPKTGLSRQEAARREIMDYLQSNLTDGMDGNLLAQVTDDVANMKAREGAAYNSVFQNAGPLGDDAVSALKDALARVPEAGDDVKRIYTARTGKKPFFEIEDGVVTFNRAPTLEDAEIVRRGIDSAASRQFRTGAGAVGTEYRGVEGGLRATLDQTSDQLRNTRANWSAIETAREAFEEGKKSLSRSPDEVEVLWTEVQKKGDRAVQAFRSGVAQAYRNKATTGSRKSLPRNISDEAAREGAIARIVFPEDQLDGLLQRANRATAAQDSANKIMGGSPTAITDARIAQNNSGMLADATEAAMGNQFAMIRLAGQALKGLQSKLSPKEVEDLARLMVETRPDVVRRAMTDSTGMQQLLRLGELMLQRTAQPTGAVTGAAAVPAGESALMQLRGN